MPHPQTPSPKERGLFIASPKSSPKERTFYASLNQIS